MAIGSVLRAGLRRLGGRLCLLAVVMLACGWAIMGPLSIARHAREEPFRTDYLAFDTAAQILRAEGGPRLYDLELQRSVQEQRSGNAEEGFVAYMHPPVVAAAFLPLAGLSARAGYAVFAALLLVAAAALGALALRLLDAAARRERWGAAVAVAGSTAVASAVISGQITPLLLLAAAGGLLLLRAGRAGAGGAVLGLLCVKPHFALAALLVLALTRQRRAASALCIVAAGCGAASLAIAGPEGVEGYVALLRRSSSDPAGVFIDVRSEQNLRGLAALFGVYGGAWLDAASALIAAAVLAAGTLALVRSPYAGREGALYAAAVGAAILCGAAPHVQYYDLAMLALPALFIVQRASAAEAAARPAFYGVLVLLVLWLEAAGILAGAKLSVSFVPLLASVAVVCAWPWFEEWLTGAAPVSYGHDEADAPLSAAA